MQFLKRHFEKIILSAVLVVLGAAAFWLFDAVTKAKRQKGPNFEKPTANKPWKGPDLAPLRNTIQSLKAAPDFTLSGDHNLFNPVTWKVLRDGRLIKQLKEGPDALTVTDIRPLEYTIRLDQKTGDSYSMAAKHPLQPEKKWYESFGDKGSRTAPYACVIVGTNDALQDPPKIQIFIPETKETVTVSANQPYRRVEMYEADLKYSASDTNNVFTKQHVGDKSLRLSGESWKIVAITSNSVTLSNLRSSKRETKEWNGGK
jgi:hypothetical protein